ncbi:MAG TPA: hypothetical protein VEG61_06655 [Candidatus Dormibacteraeota bacterium]|nr:hypothetical protein [Candidatus Dormibacteraeota bacterium]
MRTVTVRLEGKLKKRMDAVAINWSEYIRRAIAERGEREERKEAAAKLLDNFQRGVHRVPKGYPEG